VRRDRLVTVNISTIKVLEDLFKPKIKVDENKEYFFMKNDEVGRVLNRCLEKIRKIEEK
jgi:hypothetical protein